MLAWFIVDRSFFTINELKKKDLSSSLEAGAIPRKEDFQGAVLLNDRLCQIYLCELTAFVERKPFLSWAAVCYNRPFQLLPTGTPP